jgi:hypothetical protein
MRILYDLKLEAVDLYRDENSAATVIEMLGLNSSNTRSGSTPTEVAVDVFPMWRRAVVGADGRITFVEPERSQADWFGLGNPWPAGEPFPKD